MLAADEHLWHRPPARHVGQRGRDRVGVGERVDLDDLGRDVEFREEALDLGAVGAVGLGVDDDGVLGVLGADVVGLVEEEERSSRWFWREREREETSHVRVFFGRGRTIGRKGENLAAFFSSRSSFFHLILTVRACVATERRASWRRRGDEGARRGSELRGNARVAAIDRLAIALVGEGREETAALRAARREPRVHLAAAAAAEEVARAGIVVVCLVALWKVECCVRGIGSEGRKWLF